MLLLKRMKEVESSEDHSKSRHSTSVEEASARDEERRGVYGTQLAACSAASTPRSTRGSTTCAPLDGRTDLPQLGEYLRRSDISGDSSFKGGILNVELH